VGTLEGAMKRWWARLVQRLFHDDGPYAVGDDRPMDCLYLCVKSQLHHPERIDVFFALTRRGFDVRMVDVTDPTALRVALDEIAVRYG
jgi:hypothetical protein